MCVVLRKVCHTGNETLVEGLVGEVFVVLLQVLFRWGDELHGDELIAEQYFSLGL